MNINISFGQEEEKQLLNVSPETLKEYKSLAESMLQNMDTLVTLNKLSRKEIYDLKLDMLVKSHDHYAELERLREEMRKTQQAIKAIEQENHEKVGEFITDKKEQKKLPDIWKDEKQIIRNYQIEKRRERRIEKRRKEIKQKGE